MIDTSSLPGIGCKEAFHAVAGGVGYGTAFGVCTVSAARRRQPARTVSAVRDPPCHLLQVAFPRDIRRGVDGSLAPSAREPVADGSGARAAHCGGKGCASGMG